MNKLAGILIGIVSAAATMAPAPAFAQMSERAAWVSTLR
jgi:hypothetical protein